MAHPTPGISVVIPAWNEEKYLPQTLQALRKQDFDQPFETIVVNNNSTDSTEEIARQFQAHVIHEPRQGLIWAKQAGCQQAKGSLVAVLDADNIPPPHWLTSITRSLRNERVAAVTGPYLLPGAPWWARLHTNLGIVFINIWQFLFRSSPHIWGGNVAFRRHDFESFGGYDTSFSFAADEVKLRRDLAKFGRIVHDTQLAVRTSTRRFRKGIRYFYIDFLLKGYLMNYLSSALFNKPLAHPENVRQEAASQRRRETPE